MNIFQDMDMMMSQEDGFTISQAFLCAQAASKTSCFPKDDSDILTMLLTMARNSPNCEHIMKTLSLVKHSVSNNKNLKNLTKAGKVDLKKPKITHG